LCLPRRLRNVLKKEIPPQNIHADKKKSNNQERWFSRFVMEFFHCIQMPQYSAQKSESEQRLFLNTPSTALCFALVSPNRDEGNKVYYYHPSDKNFYEHSSLPRKKQSEYFLKATTAKIFSYLLLFFL